MVKHIVIIQPVEVTKILSAEEKKQLISIIDKLVSNGIMLDIKSSSIEEITA